MIIKKIVFFLALCLSVFANAQNSQYRAEREKINDVVHTKLNVSFDFENSQLNGEAWITLKPHFYEVSKVTLDAKGMLIHTVTMNGKKLSFDYVDYRKLNVELGKKFTKDQEYTLYIKYTARPEASPNENGRDDITAKGLYFIDPKGEDPLKPTQVWTEGETEINSVWFPTIDAPNQKSSQEIYITVRDNFVTLSNGTLISQKNNADGTRTDYWKQDQKHAPYLFFIGAGEFSIVKDSWNGKPVNYYVEKEYESVARDIFGNTPEMLQFYSDLLGVEYPWDKYSQMVVRDYVSGAMENTTAVIHAEGAYQEPGELIDKNSWEPTIAHEVFHHWFGDLVTAESWGNLALNEAFASYGEYLWFEYKYGKDYADDHLLEEKNLYLNSENDTNDLIRFEYADADDMFDPVSYQKGSLILHMLRNYLGDEAFFAGLKKYLIDNQYGTGEAHQLRLAMEAVSGKDLNWFFNQWFFGSSHPKLEVNTIVGEFGAQVTIQVIQTEAIFNFPLTIDVYESKGKTAHLVWVDGKFNSFTFKIDSRPLLVIAEPTGTLLAEITQTKTLKEMIYQYSHAENYIHRREALEMISEHQDNSEAFKAMTKALNDPSYILRMMALDKLNLINKYSKSYAISIVERLSKNDPYTLVRASANVTLAKLLDEKYKTRFIEAFNSKSYKVIESGVIGLYQLDKDETLAKIDELPEIIKDNLSGILTQYYVENKEDKYLTYISKHVVQGLFFIISDKKIAAAYQDAFQWVSKSDSKVAISNLTDSLVDIGLKYKSRGGDKAGINFLRQMVAMQKETSNANKDELILVIREGIAKLLG